MHRGSSAMNEALVLLLWVWVSIITLWIITIHKKVKNLIFEQGTRQEWVGNFNTYIDKRLKEPPSDK